MKWLEKTTLTLFSVLILVFSLLICFVLFGWIEVSNVYVVFQYLITKPIANHIALGIAAVCMILAVKCIFFPSFTKEKEEKTEGVLLENESGKLLISIETIENLVKSVIAGFPNIAQSNSKVKLDKQVNNVVIDLNLVVVPDTVIKELSNNIQNKIKEVMKATTEIEIKEINIKVKNIETPKEEH